MSNPVPTNLWSVNATTIFVKEITIIIYDIYKYYPLLPYENVR
jgi:hypothetical protein